MSGRRRKGREGDQPGDLTAGPALRRRLPAALRDLHHRLPAGHRRRRQLHDRDRGRPGVRRGHPAEGSGQLPGAALARSLRHRVRRVRQHPRVGGADAGRPHRALHRHGPGDPAAQVRQAAVRRRRDPEAAPVLLPARQRTAADRAACPAKGTIGAGPGRRASTTCRAPGTAPGTPTSTCCSPRTPGSASADPGGAARPHTLIESRMSWPAAASPRRRTHLPSAWSTQRPQLHEQQALLVDGPPPARRPRAPGAASAGLVVPLASARWWRAMSRCRVGLSRESSSGPTTSRSSTSPASAVRPVSSSTSASTTSVRRASAGSPSCSNRRWASASSASAPA